MLEKARQAERLTAERDAAQEKFERFRTAVTVRDEIAELERTHPSPTPLPVLRSVGRPAAHGGPQDRHAPGDAQEGEVRVELRRAAGERWRPLSRWSMVLVLVGVADRGHQLPASLFADIVTVGILPIIIGGAVAVVGLVLAVVGWWLRRGGARRGAAARRRGRPPAARPVRDRAGAARGAGRARRRAAAARADRVRRGRGAPGPRGGARRRDRPAAGAPVGPDRRREARRAAGPPRHRRARDRAEDRGARGPRADRQGAAGPRAPRGRGRGRRAPARAHPRRRGQRPSAGRAEPGRRRGGRRDSPSGWPMGREALAALRRRERIYERTLAELNTAEQATMELATRYLERRMVADIDRITGGRYRRVRVDDTNLGDGGLLARARRLGRGHRPLAGHARRRLPRRAPRSRAPRHRRPPPADRPRRPVRDPRRRAAPPAPSSCCASSPRTSR